MCEACREAHTKTRLTKGHEVEAIKDAAFYHPVLDDQQGGRGEDQVEIANSTTSMKTKMSGCEKKTLKEKIFVLLNHDVTLRLFEYFHDSTSWHEQLFIFLFTSAPLSVYIVYFGLLILAFLFSSSMKGIDLLKNYIFLITHTLRGDSLRL